MPRLTSGGSDAADQHSMAPLDYNQQQNEETQSLLKATPTTSRMQQEDKTNTSNNNTAAADDTVSYTGAEATFTDYDDTATNNNALMTDDGLASTTTGVESAQSPKAPVSLLRLLLATMCFAGLQFGCTLRGLFKQTLLHSYFLFICFEHFSMKY